MVCYIHSALPVSCFILCHVGDHIYLEYVNVLYFQPILPLQNKVFANQKEGIKNDMLWGWSCDSHVWSTGECQMDILA